VWPRKIQLVVQISDRRSQRSRDVRRPTESCACAGRGLAKFFQQLRQRIAQPGGSAQRRLHLRGIKPRQNNPLITAASKNETTRKDSERTGSERFARWAAFALLALQRGSCQQLKVQLTVRYWTVL
jgi:sporulation-control protein spo0M